MSAANPASPEPGSDESKTGSRTAQQGEARSSAIMAAGTLVSRFLGFGKTWMLGAALGLGSTVNDTFINANNLPNLIFLLVAGGVFNAVLVPADHQGQQGTGPRSGLHQPAPHAGCPGACEPDRCWSRSWLRGSLS